MIVIILVLIAILVAVAAVSPGRSVTSEYELERLAKNGDSVAIDELQRNSLYPDVVTLQRIVSAWMIVLLSVSCVNAYGLGIGVLLAIAISLLYGRVAALPVLQRFIQKYYDTFEHSVLGGIRRIQPVLKLFRGVFTVSRERQVQSRPELTHVIDEAGALLTKNEQKLLKNALVFDAKIVRDYMTPRSVIDSVGKDEILGPLTLDALHKTGHSQFPVIDGDIDHVVGMLHIQHLLVVDARAKTPATVEAAMNPKVCYIHEDQTLAHALTAFLKTKRHLFVVVNEYRETVGVLSLEDVIETLLGRSIVDEFDKHDDLRAVAARNPGKNNTPPHTVNV